MKNYWELTFRYKNLPVVPITNKPVKTQLKDGKEIIIEPSTIVHRPAWGHVYLVNGKTSICWEYTP